MAESLTGFVARRQTQWRELSSLLDALERGRLRADDLWPLERLYRATAADLATAHSQFPGTDVERFLNQLVARAYRRIYARRSPRWRSVAEFFTHRFPATVRAQWRFVAVSAALLMFGFLAGLLALLLEPALKDFWVPAELQRYVADHRLWTDELPMPRSQAAVEILTNNLRVAIGAFALGITGGVGTVLLLLYNGVFLGATVGHCINGGLGRALLVFMSAHGFVELSIIAICGGAGLLIGHALCVPQERPRAEVLRERAPEAAALVMGCAPFLTAVGVVEGFLSPGSSLPAPAKVALGAALGAAFWLYLLRAGTAAPVAPTPAGRTVS